VTQSQSIPPYSIRESSRARRVTLKIFPGRGLEVVTPKGFGREKIPQIISENQSWILRTFKKLQDKGNLLEPRRVLPEAIHLPAVGLQFVVHYANSHTGALRLVQASACSLELSGAMASPLACLEMLRSWLLLQGRLHLIPWLNELSIQTGLSFTKVQIRSQKSRWGSCSHKGTISLNSKLLFLPAVLVRYIMIHELCHTVHHNHSQRYWAFVEKLEPDYKTLDTAMNLAHKYVPRWAI
jgi:predicted metal-dependent hydrolase